MEDFERDTNKTYVVHAKNYKHDVYIGRPSKWGNPYSHKEGTLAKYKVLTRQEAISGYVNHLIETGLMDEIKELKDRLKIMIEGPKLPEMENGEFKVPASFEDLLKSIDNTLETDKNTISSLNLQFFDYVYDVKLPDNTIVKGISEEELEYYKLKYSIILDAQNSD